MGCRLVLHPRSAASLDAVAMSRVHCLAPERPLALPCKESLAFCDIVLSVSSAPLEIALRESKSRLLVFRCVPLICTDLDTYIHCSLMLIGVSPAFKWV